MQAGSPLKDGFSLREVVDFASEELAMKRVK
jgi:hypothetical protein